MQIRNILKISALLAFAGLTNTAAAFSDCPGFPQFGVKNKAFAKSGCGVDANFRGNDSVTPANRNVVVNMQRNTSGRTRRVATLGLNGTHPIGPKCQIILTSLGTANSKPKECSSAPITQIEMFIQTN